VIHFLKRNRIPWWVVRSILLAALSAESSEVAASRNRVLRPISSPDYPVVLKGKDIPSLAGVPIGRIALYAVHKSGLEPIPFQIDRRDRKGRFQIPRTDRERKEESRSSFDDNDECVFMAGDLGRKIEVLPAPFRGASAVEIGITDPETGRKGWIYALVFHERAPEYARQDDVSYDRSHDAVETDTYRIAFSETHPFLVSELSWKETGAGRTGPNLADTMKVRHRGKLFGRFDFVRTEEDYASRVTAVKDGPVRVIRRTSNRVRILWRLRTPAISIDYLCYRNAFYMDTWIDIPFRIGWFFSDVETLMTLDGNDDPTAPKRRVYSRSAPQGLAINGTMSEAKRAFNASGDRDFALSTPDGLILVGLNLEKDFPIRYRAYLMDDKEIPDPPENIPGQFGNLGFLTTNWEALHTSLHHMLFTVYLVRDLSAEKGLKLLRNAPKGIH